MTRRRAFRVGGAALALVLVAGLGAWMAGDGAEGRPIATFRGDGTAVFPLAFLPDGRGLVVFEEMGRIVLRDEATGAVRRAYRLQADRPRVAVSPDGRRLAWSVPRGDTRMIAVLDAATGAERARLEATGTTLFDWGFSPDGSTFRALASDGISAAQPYRVLEWDATTWAPRPTVAVGIAAWGQHAAFGAAGPRVAASRGTSPVVGLWDAAGMRDLEGTGPSGVAAVSFGPDGRLFVGREDGRIEAWDADAGRVVAEAAPAADRPGFLPAGTVFDRDGGRAATVFYRIWRPSTFHNLADEVSRAVGLGGRRARLDHETIVWETRPGGRRLIRLRGESLPVFSPDGRRLATSDGARVAVWALPADGIRGGRVEVTPGAGDGYTGGEGAGPAVAGEIAAPASPREARRTP